MSPVLLPALSQVEIDTGSDALSVTPHVERFPNNAVVNGLGWQETTGTCCRRKSFPGLIIRILVGTPPIKVCTVGSREAAARCNDRQCFPKSTSHWMLLESES